MPLNDEEVKDAKEKLERYKDLRENWEQVDENGNRVLVGTEEMGDIDNELTNKLIDPINEKMKDAVRDIARQSGAEFSEDGSPDQSKQIKLASERHERNMKAIQEQKAQIQAGITNEAAKKHVKKLVTEITNLRKENIKKNFEIKMLQKNGDVLVKEISDEIQDMKTYLVGVTGVFETFLDRINDKLGKRESGLNESRSNQEGRTESN